MNIVNPAENIIALTPRNPFERTADGRPYVPDELLERMKAISSEQAWSILDREKYYFQFEGNWFRTHGDRILVGRAVTTQWLPYRPDFNEVVQQKGESEGRIGGQNSWVIDTLQTGDVLVVDLYGKIREGTFVGDNLSTSIMRRTKAGAVIDGGIRDYDGIRELSDVAFFCRGMDPTPIRNTMLGGVNIPIRIGHTTVLPGDIVLGTPTGVTFIPPHLVQEIVEVGENVQIRDLFGKQRLSEGTYTPGEIDVQTWRADIEQDYQAWLARRNA
ncbi:MAG: RraA family protein [Burkholderiales bacterium]|nr:RraA family protein [Anaerolineae bacterium]